MGDTQLPFVVHLDPGREWRGGQLQAGFLAREMTRRGAPTVMVCDPSSPLERWCREQNTPTNTIRTRGEWDLLAAWRVVQLCRRQKAVILHAHSSHGLGLALICRLFYPSVKIVATRRLDFHIGRGPLHRWKYTNRGIAAVVCISNGVKHVLLSDGLAENTLTVIPDGVDPGRFTEQTRAAPPASLTAIPSNHLVVGTVAALTGHKDYPNLLASARTVLNARADVTFVAVGGGQRQKEYESVAKELQLGNRFLFAGFQSDVGAWLRRMDIFVLASRKEGMGSSILDAQSMGVAVIGTRTGGIPDLISDQVNGILVPPRDSGALAQAILRLLDSPEERSRLGNEGRISSRTFSVERMTDSYMRLYADIASDL